MEIYLKYYNEMFLVLYRKAKLTIFHLYWQHSFLLDAWSNLLSTCHCFSYSRISSFHHCLATAMTWMLCCEWLPPLVEVILVNISNIKWWIYESTENYINMRLLTALTCWLLFLETQRHKRQYKKRHAEKNVDEAKKS